MSHTIYAANGKVSHIHRRMCEWDYTIDKSLVCLQHKLCATFSANVNINYRLPIKIYYRICTLRHIRIEIIHGSQNVFWALTWVAHVKTQNTFWLPWFISWLDPVSILTQYEIIPSINRSFVYKAKEGWYVRIGILSASGIFS
jgi:hypothetical protein